MQTPCHIAVDPAGYALAVDIQRAGVSVSALSRQNGNTRDAVTFPATVTGPTIFWLPTGGVHTVSMKVGTQEIGADGAVPQSVTVPSAGGVAVRPGADALKAAAGAGRGTSSALAVPDLSVGRQGKFGIVSWDGVTVVHGDNFAMPASAAYTLDSAVSTSLAVDNAYMAWDPDDRPAVITIKQAGWYLQVLGMFFDAALAESINFGIDSPAGALHGTGNNTIDIEMVAGGPSTFGAGAGFPGWLAAGTELQLGVHASNLLADIPGSYGQMLFSPMFELAT